MSIWSEIRSEFEDNFERYIDAWTTPDDNEVGRVIAKINTQTKEITYLDERAKSDKYAQEVINDTIKEIREEQRTS